MTIKINENNIKNIDSLIVKLFDYQNNLQFKGEKEMLEKIKEIMEEKLSLDGVEITEETSFKDDLGVDSLDLFELVMALEEEFGTEIPSEELENLTTVGAVIKYIESK